MKIIQVTPNYPPSMGGVQNVVFELANEFKRTGQDVEVYTGYDGKGKKISNKNGSPEVHYLKSFSIAHTPITPSLFPELLKVQKDSILHVHVSRAFIPEIVYLVSRIKGIPYIAHYHLDIGPPGKMGFLLPLYKKYFLKKVLQGAAKIIVLSQPNKKIVEKMYGINKNIVVIPNGVSEQFFLKKKRQPAKTVNLLYVGRISVQKQVEILVNSLKYVKSRVFLHIVGDGELMREVKSIAGREKIKNIKFYGAKFGKDLLDYYKKGDIFLLSSNREGMPLVLLEAMAASLPIIASDVEGTRELVADDGILVNPNTPEKFAKEIDRLIGNKRLYKKLSQKSLEKARQYTWKNICLKISNLYKTVKK